MRRRPLSMVLEAACRLVRDLAIHPVAFEADTHGARVLAVMDRRALVTRSRGPYSPDNLPPEALATAQSVDLRLSMRPERAEFTVEAGRVWPRLVVELPDSGVLVRFVVPEDAPPVYQPKPNNSTLAGDIAIALEFVARSLRLAGERLRGREPPITVTLSYPDDPDYESTVATLPPEFADHVAPVISTIELDRGRCDRRQRAAHDAALRATAFADQPVDPLGRHGFTTRIGSACVRDGGG